jgi:glycosyltransferase involved in cell wall biosynthesis
MKKPLATPGGKRILFIAYHFPPSAAVGGRRIAHFAAAVRSFDWEPRVLTIEDDDIACVDRSRLKDVDGIPIEKAGVQRRALNALEWLWSRTARRRAAPEGREALPAAQPANRPTPGRWRRLALSLLALPDWERGWCLPATIRATRTIRRQRIKWFMTSCPPYSVHLVGLAVKALTGSRWVADFRDPWMTTGSKRMYPTSPLSMRIERWLERRVIERADLVVFNVKRLRDAYRDRYASVPAAKFAYIPNGIAPEANSVATKDDVFTISYTGSLYVGRSPEPVFAAVARLIDQGTLPANAVRLRLIGQCDSIDGVSTQTIARRHGLDAVVEVQGQVPHAEAFEIIRRSHLALLLAPNLPFQIPAKVYDYLGAGTRVLAVAEDGGTADLLRETGAGRAFRGEDVDGIAAFVAAEFASRTAPGGTAPALARYDVQRITGELIGHLTRIGAEAVGGR